MLLLAACSTTTNTNTFTPVSAKDNQAVVYFYRPFTASNAIYSPDLYLNGEFKLSLKSGKNLLLTLSPGEHTFELEPDSNYSGLTAISLNLNAGYTYYIRLDSSLKINSASNYKPYQRSFNLINIEEKLAIKEIAQCCTINSNKTALKSEKPGEKKSTERFSVDKTQNPFSH